jgi:hypothetical protein
MLSGNGENTTLAALDSAQRSRQFYLSVDPDLTKTRQNHILKISFLLIAKTLHLLWNTL